MNDDIIEISFEEEKLDQKIKKRLVITEEDLCRVPSHKSIVLLNQATVQPAADEYQEESLWNPRDLPFRVRFASSILIQILLACLVGGVLAWFVFTCVE